MTRADHRDANKRECNSSLITAASAPQHYARAQAMHAPMQCRAGERPTPELAVPERSIKLPLLI
eukprot:CAMPEP_0181199726 /NCGR_PEP_ID=MMETSP1096-20121128/17334_1 /TAXON_ID=156174 ORGANISM="Chrysochromulina ericina, Strain CCMP281" /NCGR_SAMPLE_ID=MMETSP1096 /ASSEMBLY_ACC=CAM_ASM_000453 /LENGTH=63 /DNA_ID=CAMNT_0023289935 /DNA_START=296 /DNA_END=488 /DNA_ORIENTATION=+